MIDLTSENDWMTLSVQFSQHLCPLYKSQLTKFTKVLYFTSLERNYLNVFIYTDSIFLLIILRFIMTLNRFIYFRKYQINYEKNHPLSFDVDYKTKEVVLDILYLQP